MAKTEATQATRTVPGLFIVTDASRAVQCAGEYWAGASHVPASNFSDAQIAALRADKRLDVKDQDIEVPV